MKKINRNRKIREIEFFEKQICPKPARFSIREIPFFDELVKLFFKVTFLENTGYENTLNIKLKEYKLEFVQLPELFDRYRIVFISDLHLDGLLPLSEKVISFLETIKYDIAVMGGDYRYLHQGNSKGAEIAVRKMVEYLKKRSDIIGILGNHDLYTNGQALEDQGVKMLVNDSLEIKKEGQSIFFAGVDDSSLFFAQDIESASENIPKESFKIMLSHSPQVFKEVSEFKYDLMISGHTHGGQVCLPGGFAIMKGAPVPRYLVKGQWKYKNLIGVTSTGVGVSVFPVRFNCPPEITIIELRKSSAIL